MPRSVMIAAAAGLASALWAGSAVAQNCSGAPVYFYGERVELETVLTVKSGAGCLFNISGIPGAITETVITQQPRVGKAGVRGLTPFYASKPGYRGPDEFAYTFIGTGQYGGPMRITVRRKITVVP